MIEELKRELASRVRGRLFSKEPLSKRVTYRIGGPADLLLETSFEDDFKVALATARRLSIPVTLLGNGTNLLVRDGGIRGLVVYLGQGAPGDGLDDGIEIEKRLSNEVLVRVPSHCAKARLLERALAEGWGGLEFSAGIPGSIGGAVFMNAGTKWGSYGTVIESVRLYSDALGFFEKSSSEMGFKYRGHGEGLLDGSTLVVSALFRLRTDKPVAEIRALVDEILSYRGGKQPLELPNCGSVFKNPENSALGAGRLIEACGLKGTRIGGAQVSLKHANFILNVGGATAHDVETLIERIQAEVLAKKGVALEREVILLGEKKTEPVC